MKEINLSLLIDAITKSNNVYRDANQAPINRILALWDLGDVLLKYKVDKPHSYGWRIQDQTNDLIKRMTIARAYRIREIWPERNYVKKTFSRIKGLSVFIESLPILDPNGAMYKALSKKLIDELIKYMNILPAVQFTKYIKNFKAKHKQGRVGENNDRERYLKDYVNIQNCFLTFYKQLQKLILENRFDGIDELKSKIPLEERKAFSNFCLALTSKKNIIFYKSFPISSKTKMLDFQNMFNFFKELLEDSNDIRRARLRRVVPPELLVEISDMLNSIAGKEKIINYQRRVKQSIKM
jgi:hypothetical protein